MKCLIMANGDYGQLKYYGEQLKDVDMVLCADGGANYAYKMNLIPDFIIGDMDSIDNEVREYYQRNKKVRFKKYPQQKDFTDTQLVINQAEDLGATDIIFFGTIGKRLDHTLSNIYSCIEICSHLNSIVHYSPEYSVYIVSSSLLLQGMPGEIVSTIALSDKVTSFSIGGVEYPLDNVVLEKSNPYAISNRLVVDKAEITVGNGIVVIIHYHNLN